MIINNDNIWQQVMDQKVKDNRHKGVANTLTSDELETILAVVDFFNGSPAMVNFDLAIARYRVFDWLGMAVMSKGERIGSEMATQVLVYSFLKSDGDIDRWIDDLRVTDYQQVTDWENITLE